MDLLNFLICSNKSVKLCFLCFKSDKNNLDIYTVFEIHNNNDIISLSLADMLKYLFPDADVGLMQVCNECSDLISQLYTLMYNRKYKILLLDYIVKQLMTKANATCDVRVGMEKLFLNVEVPSYLEQSYKHIGLNVNNKNYCSNKTLENNSSVGDSCRNCSETFVESKDIRSHLKNHRKKVLRRRIYHSCNDCHYKTLSKTTLQAHMNKKHLKTRPHICHICYKGFYNKSNLNEHIKTHNKQRNEICEVCGCSFIHKKNLIEHLRLHSDTRPYKCNICHKSFVTSGRRSDHIKRTHMEKTEYCLLCNKKYSLRKELTRHMNRVHLGGV